MITSKIHSALLLCILFSAVLLLPCWAWTAEGTVPISNHGKKWRIGYLQGGEKEEEYADSLKAFVAGLAELGWLPQDAVPNVQKGQNNTAVIWKQLSENTESKHLEFVSDAYWSGNWDKTLRKENQEKVIKRLNTAKDIDLMIAMGTWAGMDMANDLHSTNTIVIDASNPVESQISASPEYSGRSYIHATVEQDRYKDQFDIFHQAVQFKRLGIVYKNSPEGKAFAALEAVRAAAKDLNFTLVERSIPPEKSDRETVQMVAKYYEELAPNVDAVYMTSHLGVKPEDMPMLLRPLLEHKVPTWSQAGGWEVEQGALLGFDRPDYADLGFFQAKVMAQIFHGKAPGKISQIFDNPKSEPVCLNLKTARLIEFNPDWKLLAAAEHIYE
jgi:ABC-type uncharacterized transport system substrate-binding protein